MPATDTLFRFMEPLRLRYLDSPLPGWLRMAGEAVLSLLPEGLRRQLGMRHRQLLLGIESGNLSLRAQLDDRSSLIGLLPLDDAGLLEELRSKLDEGSSSVPRWLLLDITQVLRPVLTVPAAAEPRLREVMLHEIDRQTPFAADQVSFEPRVLSRDPATRQLKVELVVLPKARLDGALEKLGPLAQGLAGVDVVAADGQRLGVNLLSLAGRRRGQDRGRDFNRWLGLATILALLAGMWLSLDNREQALADYSARLDAAKQQARDVRVLRNALRGSGQAANFLAKRRAQAPTTLEILDDLTRRIPDSTSLEKLSINDGNMVLIGQSQQASAMVGLLQGSTLIRTPTLTGSVQTDPRTGKERFTLTAVVAGSSHDKEAANAPAGKR